MSAFVHWFEIPATDFERAMKSRNRLLSESRWDNVWLDGIEEQMAALDKGIPPYLGGIAADVQAYFFPK